MSCLLSQLFPQENCPFFSASHFGSSLQETGCLPLTMPRLFVPPPAPQIVQRRHLFKEKRSSGKTPPSFPSTTYHGWPWRMRTEFLDSSLPPTHPLFSQEKQGVRLMRAAWPIVALRKFGLCSYFIRLIGAALTRR